MGKTRGADPSSARRREERAEREARRARRRLERERRRRDRRATADASWQGHGSCGRKVRFDTRQSAETWAAGNRARFGPSCAGQVAYRCELCGGWHLTSRPWRRPSGR